MGRESLRALLHLDSRRRRATGRSSSCRATSSAVLNLRPEPSRRRSTQGHLYRRSGHGRGGISKHYKTTGIYLARIGVDGSSGNHNIRHTVLELNATNAALDAIRERHRFAGFHLIGQSGGASLIGGMLGSALRHRLRGDRRRPSCPPAATARDLGSRAPVLRCDERHCDHRAKPFDPHPRGDRPGRPAGAGAQPDACSSTALRAAGGQVEQFIVEATDEFRHGVVSYARLAASGCIRGAETAKIADDLRRLVERRVAYARKANKPNSEPVGALARPCPGQQQPARGGSSQPSALEFAGCPLRAQDPCGLRGLHHASSGSSGVPR